MEEHFKMFFLSLCLLELILKHVKHQVVKA